MKNGKLASAMTPPAALLDKLAAWYQVAKRDLPWRRSPREPYAVWVSETMLQQTRVDTVVPYYVRFMRDLPTVHALAEAPESQVLALWSGLGYYRRARMLHAAARRVVGSYGGRVPATLGELRTLEGVGAYTAGAIASIAFGGRAALVDGNVERVLARLFAVEDDVQSAGGRARLWALAESLVLACEGDPGDWNQALMELGAIVCSVRAPKCPVCPVREHCVARAQGRESNLPNRSAKRPPVVVTRIAIVVASSRAVLLARRRKDALFGGLWEPPSTEEELGLFASRLGLEARDLAPAGKVIHVLSHRRMHVEVFRGAPLRRRKWAPPSAEYDAMESVRLDDVAALAHSVLARKVLAVANVAVRSLRCRTK